MTEARLRERLQACQSRTRLALQAVDAYAAFLGQLLLAQPIPIHDAAEVLSRLDRIRTVLADKEVRDVF
jgi:hypothetical protein